MNNDFYSRLDDARESGGYDKDKIDFLLHEIGYGNKVLDVACNDGFIGEIIKRQDNDVYGFDIVLKNIQIARNRGIKAIYFRIGSGRFPYRNSTFDVIVLGDIIEHIFDTDALLKECHRLLKRDGKLIVTTPNVASLMRRMLLLFGISPFLEFSLELSTNGFPSVGHIRYYTASTLSKQLKHNNFSVTKLVGNVVYVAPGIRSYTLGRILPSLSSLLFCVAIKNSNRKSNT